MKISPTTQSLSEFRIIFEGNEANNVTKIPATRTRKSLGLEVSFDAPFAAALALREKQIQQNYRPVIGIHKWFARRPGTLFRSLLLAEFGQEPLAEAYWKSQHLAGTIADPFMGGGTSLYEASRLGFNVLGCDINPMSYWLVCRAFAALDLGDFKATAERVIHNVENKIGNLLLTHCTSCGKNADVKYFLWVKQQNCPHCSAVNDLFPGYLLAEDSRHPKNVVACNSCGCLNEYSELPNQSTPSECSSCGKPVFINGTVKRGKCSCQKCGLSFSVPGQNPSVPKHRMWALEYNCKECYGTLNGRQFKKPDDDDIANLTRAERMLSECEASLAIPNDAIPSGDETDRLHRWGYEFYRQMFGPRQLLVLGLLRQAIRAEAMGEVRDALLTVFSDILRYNNMLCRYDTYALKCQDIFSVHGYPVGLVQCENNPIGIAGVGSGGFRHFIEKYLRAKHYCEQPFEVRINGGKKEVVPIPGETIGPSSGLPKKPRGKSVTLLCEPAQNVNIKPGSLDGVFTDPPYFANVQYAELIDFCYIWLRDTAGSHAGVFDGVTTRSEHEATGNANQGRGIEEFTAALSSVFANFASGLKPGSPFVFTYHHNDPAAYAPLIVAALDAGLICSEVLPAAAEMSASLHISGTNSSVLDSVFICRKGDTENSPTASVDQIENGLFGAALTFSERLGSDISAMAAGGVKIGVGDIRCLASGLVGKIAARNLMKTWKSDLPIEVKLRLAEAGIQVTSADVQFDAAVNIVLSTVATPRKK